MSVIMMDGLISLGVVLSLWLIYSLSKHRGIKGIERIIRFNDLTRRKNLFITDKEISGNVIIGSDASRKRLFVLRRSLDNYDLQVINAEAIAGFSVKKIYKRMQAGAARPPGWEYRLDSVVLEFDNAGKRAQVQVSFNKSGTNLLSDLPALKQKTGHWEVFLASAITKDYPAELINN